MNIAPINNAVSINSMKSSHKAEHSVNNTAISFGKINAHSPLHQSSKSSIKSIALALGVLFATLFGMNSCQKRHKLPELDVDYLQSHVGSDEFDEELIEWDYSLYKYCLDAQLDVFKDDENYKFYRRAFGNNPGKITEFGSWGAPDGEGNLYNWEKLRKNDYTPETSALFVVKYEKAKNWYDENFSK